VIGSAGFINAGEEPHPFGISDPAVYTVVSPLGESTDVPNGEMLHDVAVAGARAVFDGGLVEDGALSLSFVGARLTYVGGRVWSLSGLASALGSTAGAPTVAYGIAKAAASVGCGQFYELSPGQLWINAGARLKFYRFGCGNDYLDWNAVTNQEARRSSALLEQWSQTSANVRAHANGSRLSLWMNASGGGSSVQTATFPTRMDARTVSGGCEYRLTIASGSGSSSAAPTPKTRAMVGVPPFVSMGTYHYPGVRTCPVSGTSSAPFQADPVTSPLEFWAQTYHVQVERAALFARRDVVTGLFASLQAFDNDRLTLDTNTGAACGGGGWYFPFDTRICLPGNNGGANTRDAWGSALHEYGHYIHDEYEMGGPSMIREGVADALSISVLHRLKGLASGNFVDQFSAAERTTLLTTDVGLNRRCLSNGTGPLASVRTTASGGLVTVGVGRNEVPGCNNYYSGMVLSQLMWKLINNRVCAGALTGSCSTIWTIGSEARLPFLARKAFTLAIANSSADNTIQFAVNWRANLRALLSAEGLLDATTASRVNLVFAENGL
jgi:hypothetical protein